MLYLTSLVIVAVLIIAVLWYADHMDRTMRADPVRVYLEDALHDKMGRGQWNAEVFLPALEMAREQHSMVIVELGCLSISNDDLLTSELFYTEKWQTKINVQCYHEYDAGIQDEAMRCLHDSAKKF